MWNCSWFNTCAEWHWRSSKYNLFLRIPGSCEHLAGTCLWILRTEKHWQYKSILWVLHMFCRAYISASIAAASLKIVGSLGTIREMNFLFMSVAFVAIFTEVDLHMKMYKCFSRNQQGSIPLDLNPTRFTGTTFSAPKKASGFWFFFGC